MRDPYEVLGVHRNASPTEVKNAFRRLAKKLHPDANSSDPRAAARFAELNAAHEILGDEAKRRAYDRGEIDAQGKPKFRGFDGFGSGPGAGFRRSHGTGFGGNSHYESFSFGPEGFTRTTHGDAGDFEDILREAFGGMGNSRGGRGARSPHEANSLGADVRVETAVTLPEAAQGVTRRMRLPTGKDVDVRIPAGIRSGQHVRLRGQGRPGYAGAGDALITVAILPHPFLTLDGADVKLDLPITLYEAALGGKVRVPTLAGHVELTIPPWTSSGRTFRLRGKGFPSESGTGDLLATIRVVLPERSDPEFEAQMRRWRTDRAYDPRKDM